MKVILPEIGIGVIQFPLCFTLGLKWRYPSNMKMFVTCYKVKDNWAEVNHKIMQPWIKYGGDMRKS